MLGALGPRAVRLGPAGQLPGGSRVVTSAFTFATSMPATRS
jgi:hypothetical protein